MARTTRARSAKGKPSGASAAKDAAIVAARADTQDDVAVVEALARLRSPAAVRALGRATFAEVCEEDLGLLPEKAEQLVGLLKATANDDADHRAALLALAARSSNDAPASAFAKMKLRLPSSVLLDVAKASTSALRDGVRELRAKEAPVKRGRGLTTTPEERDAAARLERDLHGLGLDRAKVTPVARNRAGAWLRIERVPLAALARLREALTLFLDPPKRRTR